MSFWQALGFHSLEVSQSQMPPLKRAKNLERDLAKDNKADVNTVAALNRSIAIMERTEGKSEELLEAFKQTRDMLHAQPLVWLNLAKHARKVCGDRIYEFTDFSTEGQAAVQKVRDSLNSKTEADPKTAAERKFFEPLEKEFAKKETFSTVTQREVLKNNAAIQPLQPTAANDNEQLDEVEKKAA